MRGPMKRRVGGEVVENSWDLAGVSRVVEKGKRHTEGEMGGSRGRWAGAAGGNERQECKRGK